MIFSLNMSNILLLPTSSCLVLLEKYMISSALHIIEEDRISIRKKLYRHSRIYFPASINSTDIIDHGVSTFYSIFVIDYKCL